jgi:hypothetical protein
MTTQNREDRLLLKDALPRLYAHMEETLRRDWPELLEQLGSLYLVRRCRCGLDGCVSFVCESADVRFAPINGRRPLSYPLDDIHGWFSVSDDGVLAGFEILNDYYDGYLNSRLVDAGLGFDAPSANATTDNPSEGPHSGGVGSPQPFDLGSEAQEQETSTQSVYMSAGATQHLIEYRLDVQAFSPEDVADFAEAAMASDGIPDVTAAQNVRYPSLLSVAVHDQTERMFKSRMPLYKVEKGFEARTVVPEGACQNSADAVRQRETGRG